MMQHTHSGWDCPFVGLKRTAMGEFDLLGYGVLHLPVTVAANGL
jgi:hypothetical protein